MTQALLNILFPKTCIFCKRRGSYLCEDCFSLIEINPYQYCVCGKTRGRPKCEECSSVLDGLFVCTRENQVIVDKIINSYSKIKELSLPLSLIILTHFLLLEKDTFSNFVIYPLPQENIRRIGFDKTKEIGKILSDKLKIPLIENIEQTKDKNILLLDITYNDKMEEIAKQLKANQVIGLVIAKH
jgi:predicted amidophosphoribosyltransferase